MRLNRLARLAAVALFISSPAGSQQPQHASGMPAMHCGVGMEKMHAMTPGQHMMPGMPGMPGDSMHRMMMDMMGPPTPAMILSHKQGLGLTASQVSQLENLQKTAAPACVAHMRLAMTTHHGANQLLEPAKPDFDAYRAKLKEAAAHMVEGHVVMAKSAVSARDVLTAAQREKLENFMATMHRRQP